ncbi:NAD-dependent epimerase/dehydratase family protein [Clostridium paraputrificum]|uniref:NAD-dependent epimerase/dehydratase family protein n=1 Tax=Clostridium paraputrificum TaxID=29363 RepID=UPI003D32CF25
MNILVLGGTRFFGVNLVLNLLKDGHKVSIATRGNAKDDFDNSVDRIQVERTDYNLMKKIFEKKEFDVVYDNLAYSSNDVKIALDTIKCNRYVMVSSAAVYNLHNNTLEKDYEADKKNLIWGNRSEFSYDEGKRLAEVALVKGYSLQNAISVRFPYVIGKDDYTRRLYFYVEHIVKEIPMYVDNLDNQIGFITSGDAGRFLSYLATNSIIGSINGCSIGTISLREIINYVEGKMGKRAIFHKDGEAGPYNGTKEYSINTGKAAEIGFRFTDLKEWIFDLLDYYIEEAVR